MTTITTAGLSPVRERLADGAVVIAKESRTTPAVTISAAFPAGAGADPPGLPGLAHFVSKVIDRGTERRSADQLAEELDSRGVSLTVGVTRHQQTINCTCLAEDFAQVLELVVDVASRATFPDEEIAKRRSEVVTSLQQDRDNPAVRAVEACVGLLYGADHPYGRRAKGSIESVSRVDRAALGRFHRSQFGPAGLTLVIVGDVRREEAIGAAARSLAGWHGVRPEPFGVPHVARPVSRRRLVLPMMNKAQADVAYGFTTITRADPAYYAFWVMNNVLGQYGLGGRLGDNIRERQGMAYYVFSSLDASVGVGPLLIRAGVSPANVDRTLAAIDEEVGRIAREGVTERELAETKQYLVGSLPRMFETNAGIAAFLQMVEQFGLGLDYDRRLPDLLGAVTLDEVAAAARALDPERATVVVAGPYNAAGSVSDEP